MRLLKRACIALMAGLARRNMPLLWQMKAKLTNEEKMSFS